MIAIINSVVGSFDICTQLVFCICNDMSVQGRACVPCLRVSDASPLMDDSGAGGRDGLRRDFRPSLPDGLFRDAPF